LEKRIARKNRKTKNSNCSLATGEKIIVSGENLIASIPRIRVRDLVRVDIPAVVVPVRVHGTKDASGILVQKTIRATTRQTMTD
jgi:hypothetical protein